MTKSNERAQAANKQLPIGKNEDVEYNTEFADEDDLEAVERANDADARQQSSADGSANAANAFEAGFAQQNF